MFVVNNPHDKIFKHIISNRENAVSLLENILPGSIQKHLSLEEIYYEKDTFISKELQEKYSDLLTSVPVIGGGQEANIYFLFEHKSTNEANTPIQLLRYILAIWDSYDNICRETGNKLPIVIPVLITHARGGWQERKISDYIDLPSEEFRAYIPEFDFILFDSVNEDPEAYDFAKSLQALLLIWKYFYSPEFIQVLKKVFQSLKQVYPELKLKDFLEAILSYLYAVRDEEEYIDIYKVAKKEFLQGDEYMGTIAEMFERKGEQRGEQRGVKKGEIKNSQEMIISAFQNRLGIVKPTLAEKIRKIQSLETLHSLFNQIFVVGDKSEFEKLVDEALEE